MKPSRFIFYLVCFFIAYSQALRLELGPVRLSVPYILTGIGLILLIVETGPAGLVNRRWDFRVYLPALIFVLIYFGLGLVAILRAQAGSVPNSSTALFRVVEQLGRLFLAFFITIYVSNVLRDARTLAVGIGVMCISSGAVALYGIYQVVATIGGFYRPLLPNTGVYGVAPGALGATRAIGTMQEPSFLAGFLCFSIIMTSLMLVRGLRRPARWAMTASLALQVICLVMTTSTGGYLGFLIAVMLGCALLAGRARRRFALIWMVAAILMTGPIIWALSHPKYQKQLVIATVGKIRHQSAEERTASVKAALGMLSDHPLTGVGPGLFDNYSEEYTTGFTVIRTVIANNVYAELLAETGLVGFLAFVGMYASVFARAVRKWRKAGRDDLLAVGPMIALVSMAVQFMAYPTFKMEFIWFLFGLVAAPAFADKRERAAIVPSEEAK